jgi:hypothetical protein
MEKMRKGRIPLTPTKGNYMSDEKGTDRNAFQIHEDFGDPNQYSDGCIVCDAKDDVPGKIDKNGGGDLYVYPWDDE